MVISDLFVWWPETLAACRPEPGDNGIGKRTYVVQKQITKKIQTGEPSELVCQISVLNENLAGW